MAKKAAPQPSFHPPEQFEEKADKDREEQRLADCEALKWHPIGRGAGKDEFLYCRLLTPNTNGPWLVATVVERRGYSHKAMTELTNETIVTEAMTRSMVVWPDDPRRPHRVAFTAGAEAGAAES